MLLAALLLSAAPPGPHFVAPSAAEIDRALAEEGPIAARLERVTRPLVGAPYVRSALGEGAPPDADPRFRLDAFDCTTFVETALALSASKSLAETPRILDSIRYEGAPSFESRRHLIESEWLPALTRDGWIREITASIGGTDTATIALVMTPERWRARTIARSIPRKTPPIGTFRIPMIPPAILERDAKSVPPGTLIQIIRADVPWSPVVVTHQGIVLLPPGAKEPIVRHASPVLKRVIDEPLARMMRRYQRPRPWPIVGVQLLGIVR